VCSKRQIQTKLLLLFFFKEESIYNVFIMDVQKTPLLLLLGNPFPAP